MQNTLYVKVRLRKNPYSNKLVALRITANYFENFKPSNAAFLTELEPTCNNFKLQAVLQRLAQHAKCKLKVDIHKDVAKLLARVA